MDDFIQQLKQKMSVDNKVKFMKEGKLEVEDKIKEADVHETIDKMDPNKIVDLDEITTKLSNIAVQSKSTDEEIKNHSSQVVATAKSSLSVIQKPTQQPDLTEEEEMAKHEDIIAFYN